MFHYIICDRLVGVCLQHASATLKALPHCSVIIELASVSVSLVSPVKNATSVTGAPLATFHTASRVENASTTGTRSSPNLPVRLSLLLVTVY